ncbi:hypothetical protein [Pseudomonas haemolytica]|uniref:hypothetical protein n=1 Tax=Pseudomonas haemolytica TaxID=2600065 RepID=UPI001909E2BB|nr:hypothetical protein [Pseudomonas haemolytica]MBK3447567.1 hypothetical protein [Pseudomonas haemolytica]
MSARDSNAARYRLDETLNDWSTKWVLDANALYCAGCSAGQPVRSADEVFRHGAGCPQACDLTKYPWRELAQMLTNLPPEKA